MITRPFSKTIIFGFSWILKRQTKQKYRSVSSQIHSESEVKICFDFFICNFLQFKDREWLKTLEMLPVSDAIYAMRFSNTMADVVDWIFFDVYKIASHFPLEVSVFAFILSSTEVNAYEFDDPVEWAQQRVNITAKFQNKSTRDNLQGLKLKCGLAVKCLLISSNWIFKKNENILYLDCLSREIYIS